MTHTPKPTPPTPPQDSGEKATPGMFLTENERVSFNAMSRMVERPRLLFRWKSPIGFLNGDAPILREIDEALQAYEETKHT